MKKAAKKFCDLGFRVHGIKNRLNECNHGDSNVMKSPFHKVDIWGKPIDCFNIIDWEDVTGFGVHLESDSLRAIDVDGVLDYAVIENLLDDLNLPKKYKWVFKSGSQCGYHILLKCEMPEDLYQTPADSSLIVASQNAKGAKFGSLDTNAYYPDVKSYGANHQFYKVEFKWEGNVVLPPSLHQSGNEYSFVNGFPKELPAIVDFDTLQKLKEKIASVQAKSSSHPYMNDDDSFSSYFASSVRLTFADSVENNFEAKIKESAIAYHLSQYSVADSKGDPLFMNQISWFVIDINDNVVKRKCFNYYSSEIRGSLFCSDIGLKESNNLVVQKRNVYHEFLFDLMHVKELICWEIDNLEILKSEIKSAGLYLDAFLKTTTMSEDGYSAGLYGDWRDEEDLKPTTDVKEVFEDFKQKSAPNPNNKKRTPLRPREKRSMVDRFLERLQKASVLEVELATSKSLNSIYYLTVFYTIYLMLKPKK